MRRKKIGWLVEELHAKPGTGPYQCREKFLMYLDEIRQALLAGCSKKSIWNQLKEKGLYSGSYSGFLKLTCKYLSDGFRCGVPEESPPVVIEKQRRSLPRQKAEAVPIQKENHMRREPQLRVNNTPINSNGEPIR